MRSLYSERLVSVVAGASWQAVTVPVGKRMVVRTIAAANASGAVTLFVVLQGRYVVAQGLQANGTLSLNEMRLVGYGGEQLGVACSNGTVDVSIHGYLFEDPSMVMTPPLQIFDVGDDWPATRR